MSPWKLWKNGFDRWEKTTADYLDGALKRESVLGPSASILKLVMQAKTHSDKARALWWKSLGLPHREEHDWAVHRINQLEGKILDLEEELRELRKGQE